MKRYLVSLNFSTMGIDEQDALNRVVDSTVNHLSSLSDITYVDGEATEVDEVVVTFETPEGHITTWRRQLALTDEEAHLKRQLEGVLGHPTSISS